MFVKSIWSIVSLNFEVSLLIFWFGWPAYWWQWFIEVSHYHCVGVYLCSYVYYCLFDEVGCTTFGAYILTIVIFSWLIIPINMKWLSFSILSNFGLNSALNQIKVWYSWLLLGSICSEDLFPPSHLKPIFVCVSKMHFW
jgi:hypothetical protein